MTPNFKSTGSATAEHERNLTRTEASVYLRDRYGIRCAVATLATYATKGGGPKFHRGQPVLYPTSALDEWARTRLGKLVSSTSEGDA